MSARGSHGPAVENGVLRYTSVSAISSFDPHEYAGCHRRWYYKYILGVKEQKTVAQKLGEDLHAELEHYLKTGEDVLSPVARVGRHLLPKPGSDLIVEQAFGDHNRAIALAKAPALLSDPQYAELLVDADNRGSDAVERLVEQLAGLTAGGVPLVGYVDVRHRRGEWVDPSGVLRREEHPNTTVELIDHKTTSSVDDFAKAPEELAETVQMTGYGVYAANVEEGVEYVRPSHVYYQTRGALLAAKRTVLVPVDDARRRWERVDGVVRAMRDVAKATRIEDVEPNYEACTAYRGCPHRSYCPRETQPMIAQLFAKGQNGMSLFNSLKKSESNGAVNGATPSTAQTTLGSSLFGGKKLEAKTEAKPVDPERQAAVDAEKKKLEAEDRAVGAGQVVPNDAPKATLANSAAPMTPDEIKQVADPEIRARAEAQAAAAGGVSRPGEKCTMAGKRIKITDAQAADREVLCPGSCGQVVGIKPGKDEDGTRAATLPANHKNPAPEEKKAPAAASYGTCMCGTALTAENASRLPSGAVKHIGCPKEQTAQTESIKAPLPEGVVDTPEVRVKLQAAVQPQAGITILVDVVVDRGGAPQRLEDYYAPLVKKLEAAYNAADLRAAPADSPLGYGKWQGCLAAVVRENPPAPGVYAVYGGGDVARVVVEALSPTAAMILRGVGR